MDAPLTELASQLRIRLMEPLPGEDAHREMKAVPDDIARARFPHQTPPRAGSVLLLLYANDSGIHFPLIRRADSGGAHSGQISLPGGKNEPGETPEQAALRETEEEIGLPAADISIIGSLSPYFVIPSNFIVQPVIGLIHGPVHFLPDRREVDRVLEAPLSMLTDVHSRRHEYVETAGRRWKAPCFVFGKNVVWGATAMILNEFRCLVKDVGF